MKERKWDSQLKHKILKQMIATGYEFIEIANKMMESCWRKDNNQFLNSRIVISFFIRRAVELSESFLILLQHDRLADSAILLRSFWEMGINTDFIFADDKKKETNAIRFLLNEYKGKIKLLERNKDEFKANKLDVEKRLAKLNEEIGEMKKSFSKQYRIDKWTWPNIYDRAKDSTSWVIKQAYNQVYTYICSIDHHDISFGKNYVDDNDKPLKDIKMVFLLRPDVNLVMWRGILLVIMKTFNQEFNLEWGDVLKGLELKQDREYEEMKRIDKRKKGALL